jgi:hypothetical protein
MQVNRSEDFRLVNGNLLSTSEFQGSQEQFRGRRGLRGQQFNEVVAVIVCGATVQNQLA